jgi:DNA-directed RNA polymerase specialized sigma24 family protein
MDQHSEFAVFTGYPSTHWSAIFLASQPGQQEGDGALNRLLLRYQRSLLSYLSVHFHCTSHDAADYLQDFVEKKVLKRDLLSRAKAPQGKFRTLLLTSLERHVIDIRRRQFGPTRRPSGGCVPLDEVRDQVEDLPTHEGSAPVARRWAGILIAEASHVTREFYVGKGRPETWAVFEDALLRPLLDEKPRPTVEQLAQKHGFETPRQASNAIITAKRHFGTVLRDLVQAYAKNEKEVDDELAELVALLLPPKGA